MELVRQFTAGQEMRQRFYNFDLNNLADPREKPRMRLFGNDTIEALERCVLVCDEILNMKPEWADARFERALVQSLLGNQEQAVSDFRWCLDHAASLTASQILLALSWMPEQEQRAAGELVLKLLDDEPGDQGLRLLCAQIFVASTYLRDGHASYISQAEAVLQWQRCGRIGSDHPIWLSLLWPLLEAYKVTGQEAKWLEAKALVEKY